MRMQRLAPQIVMRNEMRSSFCDSNVVPVLHDVVPEEAGTCRAERNDMNSLSDVVKAMEGSTSTSNLL
ncbi:uncharacterized [Tachysurus ichikawai]